MRFLPARLERQTNLVSRLLETLGIDAGAEANFDSRTESLDVRHCGDTSVVDLALLLDC
jgi:hypothetical protein